MKSAWYEYRKMSARSIERFDNISVLITFTVSKNIKINFFFKFICIMTDVSTVFSNLNNILNLYIFIAVKDSKLLRVLTLILFS